MAGDRNGGVAQDVGHGLDVRPTLQEPDRGRVAECVAPTSSIPAALAATSTTRSMFLGSTIVPAAVVNTIPVSVQTLAAVLRSASWRILWALSSATRGAASGTRRRDRVVLGSESTSSPPTRPSVCLTVISALARSTSDHASPATSPRRRPVNAMRKTAG